MKYKILECEVEADRVASVGTPFADNGGGHGGKVPVDFENPNYPAGMLAPKGTRVVAGDYYVNGVFVPAVFFQAVAVQAIEEPTPESGVDLDAALTNEPADPGVKDLVTEL